MHSSLVAVCALLLQGTPKSDSGFFHKNDYKLGIAAVAATGVTAIFDERIARWARQPSVQGDSCRHDLVNSLTVVNEVPLTLGAFATYGIGRLAGWPVVADVGAHLSEVLVATVAIDETFRITIGRVRPRSSLDDAFVFHPGGGLTHFDRRSFPSLHSAVAFATAATLSEEMRVRDAPARVYLEPVLFAAALVPGFTRIYLDQHWASDIVAGSALGAYIGTRVVQYTHGHKTRLDRFLLGARVIPTANGIAIGETLDW
jgi:membrane-associated phospholipid phosphatase